MGADRKMFGTLVLTQMDLDHIGRLSDLPTRYRASQRHNTWRHYRAVDYLQSGVAVINTQRVYPHPYPVAHLNPHLQIAAWLIQ
jgi:glyoxylase-like metal-dependent hydrolase (beta-lactamase superfamily II)